MMRDKFPLFYMQGDKIVEVAYAEWESENGIGWTMVGEVTITPPENVDKVIFETAIGCFQTDFVARGGVKLTLVHRTGGSMSRCDRTLEFQKRMQGDSVELVYR